MTLAKHSSLVTPGVFPPEELPINSALGNDVDLILRKFDMAHEPMRFIVALAQKFLFSGVTLNAPSLEIGFNGPGIPGGILHYGKDRFTWGAGKPNPWTGLFVSPELHIYDNVIGFDPTSPFPFPDSSFNTICGTELFCEGVSREHMLKECWRLLAPGGTLAFAELSHEILKFPNLLKRFQHWTPKFECLDNSHAFYDKLLSEIGFAEVSLQPHISVPFGSLMHSVAYGIVDHTVGRRLLEEEPIYLESLNTLVSVLTDELSNPPDRGWFVLVKCRKPGRQLELPAPGPVCPDCHAGQLEFSLLSCICRGCGRDFESRYGVPCLLTNDGVAQRVIPAIHPELKPTTYMDRMLSASYAKIRELDPVVQIFEVDPCTSFTIKHLRQNGIDVRAIGTTRKRLCGTFVDGVPVVPISELTSSSIILSSFPSDSSESSIFDCLRANGFNGRAFSLKQGNLEEGALCVELKPLPQAETEGKTSGASSNVFIKIENASLRFRVYCDRRPALKESIIQAVTKKNTRDSVIEFDVLKNVSLMLRGGDRVGVLGLNGAGKSTLLKMIVGIYPPYQGHVSVNGKITPLIELGTGFDYDLSGRENIYLNGSLLGRSYKQMRELEPEIVDFSELGEMIDLPIKYYSSGMLGRLAFSIGTIMQPEILIVDEIFATGDAHFVRKATNRMRSLFDNSQIVLLVTHDTQKIIELCNQAIVLHKGEIVKKGDPAEMVDFYLSEIAL